MEDRMFPPKILKFQAQEKNTFVLRLKIVTLKEHKGNARIVLKSISLCLTSLVSNFLATFANYIITFEMEWMWQSNHFLWWIVWTDKRDISLAASEVFCKHRIYKYWVWHRQLMLVLKSLNTSSAVRFHTFWMWVKTRFPGCCLDVLQLRFESKCHDAIQNCHWSKFNMPES